MNARALESLSKEEDVFIHPLWGRGGCLPVTDLLTLNLLDVKSPSRTRLTESQVKDNIL